MASTITLRAYLDELNTMLENESPTEVVSHCRHILQHFPQNVETYRLLGKALLQKGQFEGLQDYYQEAADVFQRVLTVLPNDYVAHIGLSEVHVYNQALDRAIWHLERAYEQMPGNPALQEALRELYVKRDGPARTSAKIQLTRGALARQYVNGLLYDQAVIELRTALEQAPNRADLQVLLAEALWDGQHPLEAAEVAAQLLKKLPNCLAANRIMARLWLEHGRPTEAKVFLDRIEALDPYEAIRVLKPDLRSFEDTTQIERLDYGAAAAATLSAQTPDWMQDLGELGSLGTMDDVFLPPTPAPSSPTPGFDEVFRPERGGVDARISDEQVPDEPPDWFRAFEQAAPPKADQDWFAGPLATSPAAETPADWLPPSDQVTSEPSGIPDWFNEVVQAGPAPVASSEAPVGPDWLTPDSAETPPLPSFEDLVPSDVTAPAEPDWLETDLGSPSDSFLPSFEDLTAPQPAEEPDWLLAETPAAEMPEEPVTPVGESSSTGFTDLLQGIEAARGSYDLNQDIAEAEPIAPDWLRAFEEEQTPSPEPEPETPTIDPLAWLNEPAEQSEVPSWEETLSGKVGQAEAESAVEDDPLAWMRTMNLSGDQEQPVEPLNVSEDDLEALRRASMPPPDFDLDAFFPDEEQKSPDVMPAVETPAWMPETDATTLSQMEPLAEDWLAEFAPLEDSALMSALDEAAAPEQPGIAEPTPDTAPAPAADTSDDWLADFAPLDEAALMSELEEAAAPEQPGAAEPILDTAPVTAADISDDWLADFAPLDEAALMSELEETDAPEQPGAAEPTPDSAPAPAADTSDDWLASLAVSDSEQLIEANGTPELAAMAAELPDWLAAAAPLEEAPAEPEGTGLDMQAAADEFASLFDDVLEAPLSQPAAVSEESGVPTGEDDWLQSFAKTEEELSAPAPAYEEEVPLVEEALADSWSAPEPEFDLETFPAEEMFSFPDAELAASGEAMAEPAPDEEGRAAEVEQAELALFPDEDMPSWLADLPPVEAPPAAGLEPDTAVEGDITDQMAGYRAAGATGILQPDEEPDWMRALMGEELPPDIEEEPAEPLDLEPRGQEVIETPIESPAVEERPEEPPFTDWEPALELEEAVPPETENGAIPDWLLAITQSEAGKLDSELLDEPGLYQSAEDTGVLQPDSAPDWLADVQPDIAEVEQRAEEFVETDFAPEIGQGKVAPPDVLAHTKAEVSEFDQEEWDDDESVPDDFSFDSEEPAWLRHAKQRGPSSWMDDNPAQPPNWLRDLFEDDETSK